MLVTLALNVQAVVIVSAVKVVLDAMTVNSVKFAEIVIFVNILVT